jgi:hypothetical protein
MNSQACEGGGAMAMGRMSTFKSLYVVLCATYYFFLLSFCSMRSNFCKEFKIVELLQETFSILVVVNEEEEN